MAPWILPDATPLPPALEAFLDDGEPPVYFGLGSMPAPSDTSRPLIEAARAAGRRVIISRGWANLEFADEARDCLSIDEVNHHALFPRVSVVVHHGGAGTTTAAALAGVPQIATPVFDDQFYFGRRISALGIGASVPFRDLNVGAVASALELALTPSVADRAQDFSKAVIFDGATMAAKRLATMLRL